MRKLIYATAGYLLLASSAAHAEGPDDVKLKALLPPAPDAALCLTRTYDDAHLARHPKQKVTALILFIRYTMLGEDEATLIATEDGGIEKQYFTYDFTLAAKTRESPATLYASGDCTSAEAIGCGVDCDGGGIVLERVAGNENAVLMRFSESGYIRMTPGCGEEDDAVELGPSEDDKLFKLDRSPVSLCRAMQADLERQHRGKAR